MGGKGKLESKKNDFNIKLYNPQKKILNDFINVSQKL